ncbi:phenylacetate--CoA ligase family protein [Aliiruegeria sabulilitoris]|uniref:phenylacetate--CoA ligase family protein n=1 Tax=Aliiruegeria sabulilitoris TaxID=1510458 RepID=UPI00082DF3C9|nr:AMP-binding protein [Aliiruegeria sabulilitoris]NDR58769.1 phenylacetate--CoA ligase family protein [Pseudoruegeria sp. M32A2M]
MSQLSLPDDPWNGLGAANDAAYRIQLAYLLDHSEFYRNKLASAGIASAEEAGGLDDIARLPFTEKDELRASRDENHPIGRHLAAPMTDVVRVYSTSGTTGTPSYIPLTSSDLANWVEISTRSYGASGLAKGERMVTTYNAGPFVAGVTLDAFAKLGVCHIPVGSGNTERLMTAVQLLKPTVLGCTPSYAIHLAEWAHERGVDIAASSVNKILVAGEPGGGEPAMRQRIEEAWGARVTEAMGIGDISVSLWGECTHQNGMHFSGTGFVHFELIDPETGASLAIEDGAEGELVYTHLRHEAAPLLRFRSRDRVRLSTGACACGRDSPRVRCIGRTDDLLIVRGVNVFPSAVRDVVGKIGHGVSGVISIRPKTKSVNQAPPLPVVVELAKDVQPDAALAGLLRKHLRDELLVTTDITLVPFGSLPRTEYKSKLVDWSEAE